MNPAKSPVWNNGRPRTCGITWRIDAGEWVADLRTRTAYAGHLPGTDWFELSKSLASYFGRLYDCGAAASPSSEERWPQNGIRAASFR